jgi:LPS-assembly protein
MKKQIFRSISFLVLFLSIPLTVLAEELESHSEDESVPVELVVIPQKKPVFIEADRIHGYYEQEIEAIGEVELRREDNTLTADRMKYFQTTDDAEAEGNVRIEGPTKVLEGTDLQINLETEVGHMSAPSYFLKDGSGRGSGNVLFFEGKDKFRLEGGSYTTCPIDNDDWYILADDLEIDNAKQIGTARNVTMRFKDVPIFYLPWMDFSYSGKRKTGVLAPIFGNTARSGADLAIPFYLNIAPNIDATIAPRLMSKRGFMLNNELRYLGRSFQGRVLADVLPTDIDTNETRYGVSFAHNQYLGRGWQSSLNFNRVSDDRFLRDLTNNLAQTSRTNLLQQGVVSYNGGLGAGGSLSFTGLVQRFQTLQDPRAPFVPPYKRLPQLSLGAIKRNVAGMDLGLASSWTNFSHPTLVNGKRFTLFPNVSVPMHNAFGYITPKVGLHYTRYDLSDSVRARGKNLDRTIPILSLDSGVVFDRNMAVNGKRFIQTLEPRAFYVYVPYTDQSFLPNFDSAESDFSFAQMLTENRFSGSDRINDANQVTLALTSRLLEPDTGIERLRVAVGQQFRFTDRRVILGSNQVTSRKADFIAALAGRLTREISTDINIQLDQKSLRTEKIRAGISYQPELGKVINLGYRFTRDVREQVNIDLLDTSIKQVDTSIQWPFFSNWHTVARVNYSLKDDRLLAGLAGFEYISCCWKLRVVLQKLTTATQRTTTAVFVQLELNGLMEIGSNPLRVLQQSIPGYTSIH